MCLRKYVRTCAFACVCVCMCARARACLLFCQISNAAVMSRLKLGDFSYEPQGLRLGQLRGNLFRLVLRGISEADVGLIGV